MKNIALCQVKTFSISLANLSSTQLFVTQWQPNSITQQPPIILLHDSLGCVALWKDFPEALAVATGQTVIAYDRWGFGQSSQRTDKISHQFIEQEAIEFFPFILQAFQIDKFFVLGHSVGGCMAITIANKYPKQCLSVVAISTQAFVDKQVTNSIIANHASFADAKNFARLARYHTNNTHWVLDAWVSTWRSKEFSSWSLQPYFADIICPVLVIQGQNDAYNAIIHSQTIAENIAKSHLHILPNTGHFPHRERKDEVLQLIKKFLSNN